MKIGDIKPCAVCGKGVLHSNQVQAFEVQVTRLVADEGAISRQHGLERLLGGDSAALIARAMGPDEDMLVQFGTARGLVCQACWAREFLCTATEAIEKQSNPEAKP